MINPIETSQKDFFTSRTYESNGYQIIIREIDDEKSIAFKAIDDVTFRPKITFCGGEGLIDCSGLIVRPENCERIITNIRQACEAIEAVKEILASGE